MPPHTLTPLAQPDTPQTLDPILQEILLHKFTAITEEMAITLQRSARTTYVKEAGDFGTALATPDGHFFATRQ